MPKREAAERRGSRGEKLAALFLQLKGHRILGRRVKTRVGEIDLISLPPFGPVCFVEVKTRRAGSVAAEAVSFSQRTRIARAASLYLASHPALARRGARFDIVAVPTAEGIGIPRHFKDVWRIGEEGS